MHDNSRLTPAERLERIEEFVFGQSFKGQAEQRVSRIQAVISRQQQEGDLVRRRITATGTGETKRADTGSQTSEADKVPGMEQHKSRTQKETTEEERARVHGWEHYRPNEASLPAQNNNSVVIQSTVAVKPMPSMVDELSYLEQQVFASQFEQSPVAERVHRLENQLYPSLVVAPSEALTLRLGRLFDRIEDIRAYDPHSLPMKDIIPFNEVAFARDAEERYHHAIETQFHDDTSVEEILRAERELAQLAQQLDPTTGYVTHAPSSSKHGLRHAIVSTLLNVAAISVGAY